MLSFFTMLTLDRYIVSEQLKIFWMAILLLLMVLLMDKVRFLADLLLTKNASALTVGKMLLYLTPSFLVIAAPLAVLMSTLLVFSRLSADNEITAMKASGISTYRLLWPVFLVSTAICFATLYVSLNLEHVSNIKFRETGLTLLKSNLNVQIKERQFNSTFENLIVHVNERKGDILKGVFISDHRNPDVTKVVEAKEGEIVASEDTIGAIDLKNGVIHTGRADGSYQTIAFDFYSLKIDYSDAMNKPFEKDIPHLSPKELREVINDQKARGKAPNAEIVALHKKYSAPAGCIVLGFLAAALGLMTKSRGTGGGFGLGVLMIVVNYVLWMLGQWLGAGGKLPPALAIWAPNIIMGAFAIYLLVHIADEKRPTEPLVNLYKKILAVRVRPSA